jgi:signal transduction histidine kinase
MNSKKTTAGTSGEVGTGLGLTLSAELIKKNKGEISLESELNVGTTIKITLPAKG